MTKLHSLRLALTSTAAVAVGVLGSLSPSAAATAWNDGFQDQDSIVDCITGSPSTGVSANVGWSSPTGQVPRIGEKFWIRGYAGLVGLPCSGKVGILPEIMVPAGVEYLDDDVLWDLTPAGQPQQLAPDPLAFERGANGGILVGNADYTPFTLRQGDVLEFQVAVRATRELKGPATQQPQCQSRIDGDRPCPIAQAGDHLQVAFTVTGHGGDKSYVTPFVGLFASPATGGTGTGGTGTGGTGTGGTGTGGTGTGGTGTGGTGSTPPASTGRAASSTRASWKPSASRRGRVTIVVSSAATPTGRVLVKDKGRVIARGSLSASQGGRLVIRLPRLARGKHLLYATYRGSATTSASSSAKRSIRLR